MKTPNTPNTKNVTVDEAHNLTYVVMAHRVLTDGEMFSAIRVALLKGEITRPASGETVVITTSIAA